jgi:hypothetical protein
MIFLASNLQLFFVRKPLSGLFISAAAGLVVNLSGCGSLPDAQVSYYQAKSQITVKVTRTVLCDAKKQPLVANTVAPTVLHSADLEKPQSLHLAGLRGTFTDSDIKFDLYEDGRLKGVNAAQTGQGETVLKAATVLASTLAAFAIAPDYSAECDYIKDAGGGKPLTLTYEGPVDPAKTDPQSIAPDAASNGYAKNLERALGNICVVAKGVDNPVFPVKYDSKEGDVLITARQPALLKLEVGVSTIGNGCGGQLWQGRVPVAQLGNEYQLPVPRPAVFGKQTFGATFSESGALTSIQYVSGSGASGALAATNSLATIVQGEAASAKIAEVKNEADLILQQQRLIQCKADPKSCK